MRIEIKYPIPKQAPSYAQLYVNGIQLGEWICGNDKKYLNPEKWAKQQLKKRNVVINRNIKRLKLELDRWEKEKHILNQ